MLQNNREFNCGDADGDFGLKTEKALRLLQANNTLTIDGINGNSSKNCIESLLQQ